MKEFVLKKCLKCGALVEVLQDCTCENCGIKCCGEEMKKIEPNIVDEKNVPNYDIVEDNIVVSIDNAGEENYIEWVALFSETKIGKKFLKSNEKTMVKFPYIKGSKLYAYCKKDGLCYKEVI